jgi:TPR repeat protein
MNKNDSERIKKLISLYETKDLNGIKCVSRVERRLDIHKKYSTCGLLFIGVSVFLLNLIFFIFILKWNQIDTNRLQDIVGIPLILLSLICYAIDAYRYMNYRKAKFRLTLISLIIMIGTFSFFLVAYSINFYGVTLPFLENHSIFYILIPALISFGFGVVILRIMPKTITKVNHSYYQKFDEKIDEEINFMREKLAQENNEDPEVLYLKGMGLYYGLNQEKNYPGAFSYLMSAYEKGYKYASYKLGQCLLIGRGVTNKNVEKGLELLKEAADLNIAGANYELATIYYNGKLVEEDKEKSDMYFLRAAEGGNKDAQYSLAISNLFSDGTLQNLPEAYRWLERAGEQGHPQAIYTLGEIYLDGKNVKQNLPLAYKWLYISALLGNTKSIYQLALLLLENPRFEYQAKSGLKWLRKSADLGSSNAQLKLSLILLKEKKYKESLMYLEESANMGNSEAQYRLGITYLQNQLVKRNYEKAFKYLRKAADQDYALSFKPLAELYKNGLGTARNESMYALYKNMAKEAKK